MWGIAALRAQSPCLWVDVPVQTTRAVSGETVPAASGAQFARTCSNIWVVCLWASHLALASVSEPEVGWHACCHTSGWQIVSKISGGECRATAYALPIVHVQAWLAWCAVQSSFTRDTWAWALLAGCLCYVGEVSELAYSSTWLWESIRKIRVGTICIIYSLLLAHRFLW